MTLQHIDEINAGQRFQFGRNWARFLKTINSNRVATAESSLAALLDVRSLAGHTFLDVGSGSGLFSLAARRMGACVRSFDYDPWSVACTVELKKRFFPDNDSWRIEEASILDENFVSSLGQFDIVYSWGVLHHTGSMWEALDNVARLVKRGGSLCIAIYNDQGWRSRYWTKVKKLYNRSRFGKFSMIALHAPYLVLGRAAIRRLSRRPLERGMSVWHDALDWLGGFPFEVAPPEQIFEFYRKRGFELTCLKTCGGRMGCNEFVFRLP